MKSFFIKSWRYITKILNFFGLIDEKGQLSRTNLLVYIFTMKFAFVPMQTASINDLALALAALGVYMGKKVVNAFVDSAKAKVEGTPSDVIDKIKALGIQEDEGK